MKFSIVIPAHNEEDRLPPVLRSYASHFSRLMGHEAEIILVANGCVDGTARVAREIAEKFSNIRVVEETKRIGKGGAVILGVKAAVGDYIGFVDADGATSEDEFSRLYERARGGDGVIASRWMKGADVSVPQKAIRLLSSRTFNWITRLLLGLKYKDTQCGAKIFSAEAWSSILPKIGTTRFAFDVDLLYQLKRGGYRVREEPTVWKDIEGSKVRFFNSSMDMFLAVVRMRLVHSPFRFVVRIYERIFARIVEGLRKDALFSHAMMLFAASMIGHVCNVGYQWVVNGALPPAEYALLATFLSLFAIVTRPLGTLATATTHYTSLLMQEGRTGTVKRLIKKWLFIAGVPSLACAAISMAGARPIASFFGLERIAPVVVFAAALPALFLTPVVTGALRGMQQFGWTALASISGTVGRLAVGAAMVLLVFPACGWALVGHASGLYLNLLFSIVVLVALVVAIPADSEKLPSFRNYLAQCFFIQFSMAILLNADVVFVRHFIPEDTDFAKAATLGRMVVFMTGAITASMFPKVASAGTFTQAHRNIYLRGLAYTSLFVVGSLVFCFFFPHPLLRVLFHVSDPSSQLVQQTGFMSLVMSFAVLLSTNVSLLVAQRRFKGGAITLLLAAGYFVGVQFFHESALQVILISGVANAVGMVFTTWLILRQEVKGE